MTLAPLASFALLASPRPAHALQLELGARVGYSAPIGDAHEAIEEGGDSLKLSEFAGGQVPWRLDLGLRVIPHWSLGLYVQMDPTAVGSQVERDCDEVDADCGGFGFRLGLQTHIHFLPGEGIDPWVGVGIGLEAIAVAVEVGDTTTSTGYSGFEYPLQAGVDFKLLKWLYIGPNINYTLGTYTAYFEDECQDGACTDNDAEDIAKTAAHSWLTVNARLTFVLF